MMHELIDKLFDRKICVLKKDGDVIHINDVSAVVYGKIVWVLGDGLYDLTHPTSGILPLEKQEMLNYIKRKIGMMKWEE